MDRQFASAVGAKDLAQIIWGFVIGQVIAVGLIALYCHFVPV